MRVADMASNNVQVASAGTIPVVDISPLIDNSDPHRVARALHAASQGLGFIYVSGHGIAPSVIDSARAAGYEFFRSTDAVKESVRISSHHRGWLPQGGARMQDDVPSDLKESFVWGNDALSGERMKDHFLRGPNRWPDAQVAGFRAAATAWFDAAHEVAHHLMRGFALGLALPEQFFLGSCDAPLSRASMVYYPPQEVSGNQFGVGPHTDFGVLTVLCQDDVGGLQVQTSDDHWVKAPPVEDTLVINVADLLSRWTAGAYRSTPHRVINQSGRERLSLVLAFDPNPETVVDARQVFGESAADAEPAISCGDYLSWRFEKAFAHRKGKTPGGATR